MYGCADIFKNCGFGGCFVFYFALNYDVKGHYVTVKAIVCQPMKIHGREGKQLIMKSRCIQYVLGGWRLWFY